MKQSRNLRSRAALRAEPLRRSPETANAARQDCADGTPLLPLRGTSPKGGSKALISPFSCLPPLCERSRYLPYPLRCGICEIYGFPAHGATKCRAAARSCHEVTDEVPFVKAEGNTSSTASGPPSWSQAQLAPRFGCKCAAGTFALRVAPLKGKALFPPPRVPRPLKTKNYSLSSLLYISSSCQNAFFML